MGPWLPTVLRGCEAVAFDSLTDFRLSVPADWSPGFDGSSHLPAVKEALRDPANLAAAIGYYRAMWGGTGQAGTAGTPTQPVLYLHGRNDGCLGVELVDNAAMFLSADSRVEVLDDCGHFLQVEQPDAVNKLVVDWVS